MGKIRRSKHIVSRVSQLSCKKLVSSKDNKYALSDSIDSIDSIHLTNMKNIKCMFLKPIVERNLSTLVDGNQIIKILESVLLGPSVTNTDKIIVSFLIDVVLLAQNNLQLFSNIQILNRSCLKSKQDLIDANNIIDSLKLSNNPDKIASCGSLEFADIKVVQPEIANIRFLSYVAARAGPHAIIHLFYHLFKHGAYDINAVIDRNTLKIVTIYLQSLGFTPDPCTGKSPALVALEHLEQNI